MTLYCATTNPGKLREFRLAAERLGRKIEIATLPNLSSIDPVEETGETFEENAIRKAVYYSAHAPGPLFADDSGLEVDALGGEPGVRSARFAGPGATNEANNLLLLEKLRGVERRTARFVCLIALAEKGSLLATFRGVVEGEILHQARGNNGFGYDPLFFYPPFGCSFGELGGERKLLVSHRGQALRQLLAAIGR
ncbi:MAG: RdgB/HAM1 family non-canonical purine NTP pyrophosphatase [Bryobacteraceae bacterium]